MTSMPTPDFNTTEDLFPRKTQNISFLGGPNNFITTNKTFLPSDLNQVWVVTVDGINLYLPDDTTANAKLNIIVNSGLSAVNLFAKPVGSPANRFIADSDLIKQSAVTLSTGSFQVQLSYLNSGDLTELTWVITADNALTDIITSDQMVDGGDITTDVTIDNAWNGKVYKCGVGTAGQTGRIFLVNTITNPFYFWVIVGKNGSLRIACSSASLSLLSPGMSVIATSIAPAYDATLPTGVFKIWYDPSQGVFRTVNFTVYDRAVGIGGSTISQFNNTGFPQSIAITRNLLDEFLLVMDGTLSNARIDYDLPTFPPYGSVLTLLILGPAVFTKPYATLQTLDGSLIVSPSDASSATTLTINNTGIYKFAFQNIVTSSTSPTLAWVPLVSNASIAEALALTDLSDVAISGPLTSDHMLKYDGVSQWRDAIPVLNNNQDVNISGVGNSEVLVFSGAQFTNRRLRMDELDSMAPVANPTQDYRIPMWLTSQWVYHLLELNGLKDVTLSAGVLDDILMYDTGTTSWKNRNKGYLNGILNFLNLSDVASGQLTTTGRVLYWNAGAVNSIDVPTLAGTYLSIGDLSDVNLTGVGDREALWYDSGTGDWIPRQATINDLANSEYVVAQNNLRLFSASSFDVNATNNTTLFNDVAYAFTTHSVNNRDNFIMGQNIGPKTSAPTTTSYILSNTIIGNQCMNNANLRAPLPQAGNCTVMGYRCLGLLAGQSTTFDHYCNSCVAVGLNNNILPYPPTTDLYVRDYYVYGNRNKVNGDATPVRRYANVIGANNNIGNCYDMTVIGRDNTLNNCYDILVQGRSINVTSALDSILLGRSNTINLGGTPYIFGIKWGANPIRQRTTTGASQVYCDNTTGEIFRASSDQAFKENIEDLTDTIIDKALALTPRKYNYIGETETRIGLIAQDCDTNCAELCQYRPTYAEGAWDEYEALLQTHAYNMENDPDYTGDAPPEPVPLSTEPSGVNLDHLTVVNLHMLKKLYSNGVNNGIYADRMFFSGTAPRAPWRSSDTRYNPTTGELQIRNSSSSVKENIVTITDQEASDIVDGLVPKKYNYVGDVADHVTMGLIAEDVDTLSETHSLAECLVVKDSSDNPVSVDYVKLVNVLLIEMKAIKTRMSVAESTITSQANIITDLQDRLTIAENTIVDHESRISTLEP